MQKKQSPIIIEGYSTKELIDLLKLNKIEEGFSIKKNSKVKKISLWANSSDNYHKIKSNLKEKNVKFYTFTPKQEKPISLILKGLSLDTSTDDIVNSITDLRISNITLTKVWILKSNFNSRIFLVQLSPLSAAKNLTSQKAPLPKNQLGISEKEQ